MSAPPSARPLSGESSHQREIATQVPAAPDYQGGFPPYGHFGPAKESRGWGLLNCLPVFLTYIGHWPAGQLMALVVVGSLTYLAHQVLAARDILGPVPTLLAFLAAVLPIAAVGVIALLHNATSDESPEDAPSSGDDGSGPKTTGATTGQDTI